jgi:tol-pal system protein YbgF
MTFRYWPVPLLLILPSACLGADKDMVRLQRDVALLDEDVHTMQQRMDQQTAAMSALLRQTLDRVNEVNTANTGIRNSLRDRLRQQEKDVSVPLAALGARLDQVASDTRTVKEDITGLNARLERLEQKLVDVENAVKSMQAPPPSVSEALGGPPAGLTAEGLFQAAMRDQLGANFDLALREYQDYLRYFGNTELAVASQFHIGEILFYQGDLASALEAFEQVLERYPKSGKAPDALYLKAKVLDKLGRHSQAVRALSQLVRAYPNSDAANRAQAELKRSRTIEGALRAPPRK